MQSQKGEEDKGPEDFHGMMGWSCGLRTLFRNSLGPEPVGWLIPLNHFNRWKLFPVR